jgi:hypothetical protein
MLFIRKTWASGAHDRATWYILNSALCPPRGSSGFGGSFLAAVCGDSEQLANSSKRAQQPGSNESLGIIICVPF